MVRYTKIYSEGIPELKEDDIFTTIIPLENKDKSASQSVSIEEKIVNIANKNVGENVGENINKTQNKILEIIQDNKEITIKELALKLNLTTRTIERNTNQLKLKGIIERVSSDREGFWKINI